MPAGLQHTGGTGPPPGRGSEKRPFVWDTDPPGKSCRAVLNLTQDGKGERFCDAIHQLKSRQGGAILRPTLHRAFGLRRLGTNQIAPDAKERRGTFSGHGRRTKTAADDCMESATQIGISAGVFRTCHKNIDGPRSSQLLDCLAELTCPFGTAFEECERKLRQLLGNHEPG